MRQLPSFHVGKWSVTEFDDGSMNFEFSGMIGLDPLVRVFKMSDASPAPMLVEQKQTNNRTKWEIWEIVKNSKSYWAFTHCNQLHRLDNVIRRIDFRSYIFVRRQRLQRSPNRRTPVCNAMYSRGLEPSPFHVVSIWWSTNRWWWQWVLLVAIVVELFRQCKES